MSIELRILTGARAGQTQSFDKSVVAIGRHPLSDLRFDVNRDLDVSTTHGEIRGIDGRYSVYDSQSTNGTFVNRERIPAGGSRELHNGDVIAFGENGPTVAVHIVSENATPEPQSAMSRLKPLAERSSAAVAAPAPAGSPYTNANPPGTQRRPTSVRVAEAVKEQTRWLRWAVVASVIVLGGVALSVYYMGHRETAARDEEIRALISTNEQLTKSSEDRLKGMSDTSLTNALRHTADSLTQAVRQARGAEAAAKAMSQLKNNSDMQRKLSEMDMPAVRDANDAAIVLITTEIGGAAFEATGFSVSSGGLLITNRHVVSDNAARASRILVKFANTSSWHHAHIVKLPSDTADLALLQIDEKGTYPAVRGVDNVADTPVGGATLTLGFPEGTDLPMEGRVAKTSLVPGVVSKSMSTLLQINSFATHGSSGSPVFDGHGHVIGVISSGVDGTPIVYAVPGAKVAELIRSAK